MLRRVSYATVVAAVLFQAAIVFSSPSIYAHATRFDFETFYQTARALHQGSVREIYSRQLQEAVVPIGEHGPAYFYHSPQELPLLYPLGWLSHAAAYWLWMGFNFCCLLLACWVLPRTTIPLPILALAFFPTLAMIFVGQDSGLLLLFFALAFRFFTDDRDEWAGIVLALSLFKPQYALVVVCGLACLRQWRIVKSFCLSASLLGTLSAAALGWKGTLLYLDLLRSHGSEARGNMINLRGLVEGFGLAGEMAIPLSLAAFAYFVYATRSEDRSVIFSSATALALLISYHGHAYDGLLLLIPCAVLLAEQNSPWVVILISSTPAAWFLWRDAHLFPLAIFTVTIFVSSLRRNEVGFASVNRRLAEMKWRRNSLSKIAP